jgi:hypothetical protein
MHCCSQLRLELQEQQMLLQKASVLPVLLQLMLLIHS